MGPIGARAVRVRTVFAAGTIAWRRTFTTRRAIGSPMTAAFVAISWRAVAGGWTFAAHVARTLVCVVAWPITRRRSFGTTVPTTFIAISSRAVVATAFRTPMTMAFFTIARRWA